ncbi:RNA polymerase sigma factor [Flagellimonas allohymeniacidonis]|uniref:Sigma-70 family RNA polymerase sigma factor n=1 Tax=Flagellimonas allohymeniacidonis TaxID=2517819 RepID=A0A4V2HS77_9FLAO|nr:sigma-70 family RNA polymerase sigma factor [Allomuricauda hymeniacidonis]TAI46640.1 sigma-70 family RNA polymerase sigma factor [Allomuricauda hymeniacidonis]
MKTDFADKRLIDRLVSGDKNALYTLYDKYSGALYGVILRMCRDEGQAQDLLQETFVKIWKNIASYDASKGRFYTWAYRIARNTTLNGIRSKKELIQTDDLSVYDSKMTSEEAPDYTELTGSIKKLEPHHQKAIALVYYEGYTHQEAHEVMGVPLGTFKSYIRQALKQLRNTYSSKVVWLWFTIELMA